MNEPEYVVVHGGPDGYAVYKRHPEREFVCNMASLDGIAYFLSTLEGVEVSQVKKVPSGGALGVLACYRIVPPPSANPSEQPW